MHFRKTYAAYEVLLHNFLFVKALRLFEAIKAKMEPLQLQVDSLHKKIENVQSEIESIQIDEELLQKESYVEELRMQHMSYE
ncbi:hypothetical protein ACT4UT_11030, partial [Bacillus sp. B-TM1]